MEAVIFVGLPASGKSTYFENNLIKTHVRINLDSLKTRERENTLLTQCIESKKDFVIDNTNVTIDNRKKYIMLAKAAGYRVVCYYFDIPIEECKKRNEQRDAKVPVVALYTIRKKMVVPTLNEGFEQIITIFPNGRGILSSFNS